MSKRRWILTFPSPCGEKVGINLCNPNLRIDLCKTMFPSPCGEKVGINRESEILEGFPCPSWASFRPLAGKR